MASGEDWDTEVSQPVTTATTITDPPRLNDTSSCSGPSVVTPAEDSLLDSEWTRPQTLKSSTGSSLSSSSTQPPSVPESDKSGGDTVDGAAPMRPVEPVLLEPLVEQIEGVDLEGVRPAAQTTTAADVPMPDVPVTSEPSTQGPSAPAAVPSAPAASSGVGWTDDIPPAQPTAPKPAAVSSGDDDWDKQVHSYYFLPMNKY